MNIHAESPWPNASHRLVIAEIALIFALFFIHGAAPVPEVNEPHYLAKAKHYWNPQWCGRDFFLQSADAHQVFYWSFGWLSLWLPLPALAWTGRIVTWLLLAWSWRRLSWAVVPRPLYAVLSAALLVALNFRLHMAGEWIIGGVEAKGFAYVFVFLGLAALVRGHWNRTWLFFGAASAFHVIIGAWSVLAAGMVWLLAGVERPPLRSLLPGLLGGLALSLPGLAPAVVLTLGQPYDVVSESTRIYVFERLAHHLVALRFPWDFVLRQELLFLVWLSASWWQTKSSPERAIRNFVIGTLVIAAVGVVIGLVTRDDELLAAQFLRYYWFRMSDVMLPLGVALQSSAAIGRLRLEQRRSSAAWLVLAMAVGAAHFGEVMWRRQANPKPPADTAIVDLPGWRDACRWAAENTPDDALFMTPRLSQTFRWYAGRAEVVSRKDIPQDAAGIVEWFDRLQTVHSRGKLGRPIWWRDTRSESLMLPNPDLVADRYGPQYIVALLKQAEQYGADYIIAEANPPLALPQVNPRGSAYAIYRLPTRNQPNTVEPQALESKTSEAEPNQDD